MPVQAIVNLKNMYPQYADVDDLTLATKLAQKYSAYSELPGQVAMERNASNPNMQGGANAPDLIQARQDVDKAAFNVSPIGFAVQHPLLAGFQGTPELLTGTTAGQAVRNMWGNNPVNGDRQIAKSLSTLGADALDTFTSPANLLAMKVAQPMANAINNGAGAVGKFTKNLIMGPELAKQAGDAQKLAISQQAAQDIANTQRLGNMKLDIARRNGQATIDGYNQLSSTLQKKVANLSDSEAQNLQTQLPKVFGRQSDEYGKKLNSIIESLPASRSSVPADNVVKGIEDSLVQHGVLRYDPTGQLIAARTTLTPTESRILDLYNSSKGQLANNPGARIDIQDLMKNQQFLRPKFGKAWTPDNALSASVAENISGNVESHVPEIAKLRSDYRPFLQWKSQAIKQLQPFSNTYETGRATNLLSKVGSPNISPDEQRLVSKLEDVIGNTVGNGRIAAMNRGLVQTQNNAGIAKQKALDVVADLKDKISKDVDVIKQNRDLSMQDIDNATQRLVNKYKNQRLLVGGGLTLGSIAGGQKLLEYFIRRNIHN